MTEEEDLDYISNWDNKTEKYKERMTEEEDLDYISDWDNKTEKYKESG